MIKATANISRDTPICNMYRDRTEKITKELEGFLSGYAVKRRASTEYTQYKNKEGVISNNKAAANRKVGFASRGEHFLSKNDINRQQAEDFYNSYILPEVEKIFNCRDNGVVREVPIIGVIHVLQTNTNTEESINFLCSDPDTIYEIIQKGSYLEFTKVIDLLLNKINNSDITERQSRQAFFVLNKLYKKLPEIDHIKPSLYGKMHALFSLLINDNRIEIINTLTEAMTGNYNKKYFNLYINDDSAIENNYLDLINKIYSSIKESQKDDCGLFKKLLSFLGANDLIEAEITSAKVLYLATSISNIVSNFDESHQEIFIKYFLNNPIDNNKLDNLLLQTLEQNGLLEKYNIVINNSKDISKIPKYNIINYLVDQDQKALTSIDNEWLSETVAGNRKQLILSMIDKLDVYSCLSLANYLSSTDDIVFKKVIASKSTKVYKQMIDLLITKLQSATTVSKESSDKITYLLNQLYVILPSIGTQSRSLCSKIYEAFGLLIPQSIEPIMSALHQATKSNPYFYLPSSVTKNKKVISDFLDLVAKIYKTPTDDYNLLYGVLKYIRTKALGDISYRKILFFTDKTHEIIINLPDETQDIVIEPLLYSL